MKAIHESLVKGLKEASDRKGHLNCFKRWAFVTVFFFWESKILPRAHFSTDNITVEIRMASLCIKKQQQTKNQENKNTDKCLSIILNHTEKVFEQ